jgi:hypothetical protein
VRRYIIRKSLQHLVSPSSAALLSVETIQFNSAMMFEIKLYVLTFNYSLSKEDENKISFLLQRSSTPLLGGPLQPLGCPGFLFVLPRFSSGDVVGFLRVTASE